MDNFKLVGLKPTKNNDSKVKELCSLKTYLKLAKANEVRRTTEKSVGIFADGELIEFLAISKKAQSEKLSSDWKVLEYLHAESGETRYCVGNQSFNGESITI